LSRLLRARDEEDNGMNDRQLHDEVDSVLDSGPITRQATSRPAQSHARTGPHAITLAPAVPTDHFPGR
jgi:hypothetical protein